MRLRQVDADNGAEPALTLITEAGGGVIASTLDIDEANSISRAVWIHGRGRANRGTLPAPGRDGPARPHALAEGLRDTRTIPVNEAVAALPKELITGANRDRLTGILERYRQSLYPDNVKIDPAAVNRVADAHRTAGLLASSCRLQSLARSVRR